MKFFYPLKQAFYTLAALAGLIFISQQALAIPIAYNFSQGGYTGGASISGMVTLDDLNFDGTAGGFPGPPEVVSLMGSFSGNVIVPAFSFTELDLFGFIWFPALGPLLGDDPAAPIEGIGITTAGGFGYSSGLGPTGGTGGVVTAPTGAMDTTSTILLLTPKRIPEPSTIALIGLALLGLCFTKKARKTAS